MLGIRNDAECLFVQFTRGFAVRRSAMVDVDMNRPVFKDKKVRGLIFELVRFMREIKVPLCFRIARQQRATEQSIRAYYLQYIRA